MTYKIKICGVRTIDTLRLLHELKVDFAGFVFHPKSPRNISFEEAKELNQAMSSAAEPQEQGHGLSLQKVAVVVNPDDNLLENIMSSLKPNFIQLHGQETPARTQQIKDKFGTRIIKAFPVSVKEELTAISAYEGIADYFMFDAKPTEGEQAGGLGRSFDWSILKTLKTNTPWFLAGGLTPANVSEALKKSGAKYVDVSSGVEEPAGIKSEPKIREFVSKCRFNLIANAIAKRYQK